MEILTVSIAWHDVLLTRKELKEYFLKFPEYKENYYIKTIVEINE